MPNTSKPIGMHNVFRFSKFASSQRLHELQADTARKHEETAFVNRKNIWNATANLDCEDRTLRRTHRTRGTHAHFFSCTRSTLPTHTRWLKCELYFALSSHPCFIAPCLMHSCPHSSVHFPAPTPNPMSTPSLLFLSTSSITAPPPGGLLLGRVAEQSPLTVCSIVTQSW